VTALTPPLQRYFFFHSCFQRFNSSWVCPQTLARSYLHAIWWFNRQERYSKASIFQAVSFGKRSVRARASGTGVKRDAEGRLIDKDGWVIGFSEGVAGEVDKDTAERARGTRRYTPNTTYDAPSDAASTILATIQGSHYQFLGLSPSADTEAIRKRYRTLSKMYHPDTTTLPKDEAGKLFIRLQDAYDTLATPDKRQYYDWRMTLEASQSMKIDGKNYTVTNSGRRQFQGDPTLSAMDKLPTGENLELNNQAQFALAFDAVAFGLCFLVICLAFVLPESPPPPPL